MEEQYILKEILFKGFQRKAIPATKTNASEFHFEYDEDQISRTWSLMNGTEGPRMKEIY